MRSLKVSSCVVLAALFISSVSVLAEDKSPQSSATHVPSLGDMMLVLQLRHAKLWYAARQQNWALANYELTHLGENLKDARRLYADLLATNATDTDNLAALIGQSLEAKDEKKFEKAFADLTAACNGCHEATGRAFIFIKTPTLPSPYSNQLYGRPKK